VSRLAGGYDTGMANFKTRLQDAAMIVGVVLIGLGLVDRRDGVVIAGAILAGAALLAVSRH
jgi:hypothetical protein